MNERRDALIDGICTLSKGYIRVMEIVVNQFDYNDLVREHFGADVMMGVIPESFTSCGVTIRCGYEPIPE